jgi:hypothetical protein
MYLQLFCHIKRGGEKRKQEKEGKGDTYIYRCERTD